MCVLQGFLSGFMRINMNYYLNTPKDQGVGIENNYCVRRQYSGVFDPVLNFLILQISNLIEPKSIC